MGTLNVTSDNRPSIFIASTTEALPTARAVKSNFDNEADVDIWTENIFSINESFLSTLLNRSTFYDYAIVVLTPDDEAIIREKKYQIPRDNLLFEFGLFMGRIGSNRAFIIAEENVKILSDFEGIKISKYRIRENLVAAVGNACEEIRRKMHTTEKSYRFSLLPSTALAIGYYKNFIEKVSEAFQTMDEYEIFERNNNDERIHVQERKIKNRFPTITILLPQKLSHLKSPVFKMKTQNLKRVNIQTISRPYPFYLEGDIYNEDNLNFFDIPTTLLASLETIDLIFERDFLDRDKIRESIERREISNFEKTLRTLMPERIESNLIKFDILK